MQVAFESFLRELEQTLSAGRLLSPILLLDHTSKPIHINPVILAVLLMANRFSDLVENGLALEDLLSLHTAQTTLAHIISHYLSLSLIISLSSSRFLFPFSPPFCPLFHLYPLLSPPGVEWGIPFYNTPETQTYSPRDHSYTHF